MLLLNIRLKAMMKSASSPENVSVQEKLKFLKAHSYSLSSSGHSFRSSFTEAIDCFINTGNCTPVNSSQIVCLNPTLLKVDKEHLLEVNISSKLIFRSLSMEILQNVSQTPTSTATVKKNLDHSSLSSLKTKIESNSISTLETAWSCVYTTKI